MGRLRGEDPMGPWMIIRSAALATGSPGAPTTYPAKDRLVPARCACFADVRSGDESHTPIKNVRILSSLFLD